MCRGLTVRMEISSVTAWTGRMTAHVVWDWAADCARHVVGEGPVSKAAAARLTDTRW